MARTALIMNDVCLRHMTGTYHPETPARLIAIQRALDAAGLSLPILESPPASEADLLRNHTPEHIDRIKYHCRTGIRYPDQDTVMGPGSWEAALYAAGSGITACKAVLAGEYDNVFCAVRPPGHHAESDRAMGFCLFNNIAIAARWLTEVAGLERVAIVDWDVHHGNGTQHSFYENPTVYYMSMHEFPLYPGTGLPTEYGDHHTNLNIPIATGSGPAAWLDAFRDLILPPLTAWQPEFLLISAGFDAHHADPLASQVLDTETYGAMTRLLRPIAGGRMVAMLEGGYDLDALGDCVVETLRAMQE